MKLKRNTLIEEEVQKYRERNKQRYAERNDDENMMPIGISDAEFVNIATNLFLGSEWYSTVPMSRYQINEEILETIISKFIKKN